MIGRYPRGFVKEAQQIAAAEGSELGLGPFDPLAPWELAKLHGIRVLELSGLAGNRGIAGAVRTFTEHRQAVFSAALLPRGKRSSPAS